MPRQDVPYGGAICRLKERIAEIWDKLGEKLHTINGVPGDGDGNVKIVSGSSAVVINNDPTQNEIEVSLDTSQLPAASVSSVNGQTGAVALDAGDIPTVGGDVQADLQDLANDISGNTAAINAEVLARQQGDASLQTNINTVSASLPSAAAAAVAADPTVAQLAADVPNKVDKITSGSSLKAYTHTGATQGETSVVDGTSANSIGIRDANGRMQAADPASGATDKTLVTANWVSQTGDSSPNNLVHKRGAETIHDSKSFTDWMHLINSTNNPTGLFFSPFLFYSYTENNSEKVGVTEGFVHEANGDQAKFMTLYNEQGNEAVLRLQYLANGTIQLVLIGNGRQEIIKEIQP